ncbi:hypothetical protein NIES2107_41760 [Nostoc carneum NIES-2107]|nr:hypothetical protein NIES2107_41760 [Nostoc carneum NIES-2107]
MVWSLVIWGLLFVIGHLSFGFYPFPIPHSPFPIPLTPASVQIHCKSDRLIWLREYVG